MSEFLGPAWALNGEPFLIAGLGGQGFPRARERQRTRIVVDDFGNAVAYQRRCAGCYRWLPLDFEHFWPGAHSLGMGYRCHDCTRVANRIIFKKDPERYRAKVRENYRKQVERDPEWHARKVARDVEATRRRRKANPDVYREYDRRYRERLRADEERHAARLEAERMTKRIRRIDAGKRVRAAKRTQERMGRLPTGPLLAAIETWLDGRDYEAVDAFLDPRNLRAWRRGEYTSTTFDIADRVLIGIDLLWWEVWKPGEDGHERAFELFAGEAAAA